jgi:hypothetical protein|tara:strand:+ start:39 stop:257 length:219 start_codon:yes stop_codon:yes gene_type:complete
MKIESAILIVKNTDKDTSNDINSEKTNTQLMISPLPNLITTGLIFLTVFAIITTGYIHGHMSISAVYKTLNP